MYGNGVRAARGVQKLDAGRSEPEIEGWAQGDPQMRHPEGQEKAEWAGMELRGAACKKKNDRISSRELPHVENSAFVGFIAARGGFDAFAGGEAGLEQGGVRQHLHIQRGLNHETP